MRFNDVLLGNFKHHNTATLRIVAAPPEPIAFAFTSFRSAENHLVRTLGTFWRCLDDGLHIAFHHWGSGLRDRLGIPCLIDLKEETKSRDIKDPDRPLVGLNQVVDVSEKSERVHGVIQCYARRVRDASEKGGVKICL